MTLDAVTRNGTAADALGDPENATAGTQPRLLGLAVQNVSGAPSGANTSPPSTPKLDSVDPITVAAPVARSTE
jgi:hypothetical protein